MKKVFGLIVFSLILGNANALANAQLIRHQLGNEVARQVGARATTNVVSEGLAKALAEQLARSGMTGVMRANKGAITGRLAGFLTAVLAKEKLSGLSTDDLGAKLAQILQRTEIQDGIVRAVGSRNLNQTNLAEYFSSDADLETAKIARAGAGRETVTRIVRNHHATALANGGQNQAVTTGLAAASTVAPEAQTSAVLPQQQLRVAAARAAAQEALASNPAETARVAAVEAEVASVRATLDGLDAPRSMKKAMRKFLTRATVALRAGNSEVFNMAKEIITGLSGLTRNQLKQLVAKNMVCKSVSDKGFNNFVVLMNKAVVAYLAQGLQGAGRSVLESMQGIHSQMMKAIAGINTLMSGECNIIARGLGEAAVAAATP